MPRSAGPHVAGRNSMAGRRRGRYRPLVPGIFEPELSRRLRGATHVLIAGAGGGFDVYAGLPLALALREAGTRVTLASFAVSELDRIPAHTWLRSGLVAVGPDSPGNDRYFPERTLARWLDRAGHDPVVYAFARTGVRPLRAAYRALIERLGVDAVVLADGGTDILMRGDEAGIGTPEEDMTSLAAVAGLDVPVKAVVSLGFGIDSHHGICHAHVLENLASLQRAGAYLGGFSIPPSSAAARAYVDAVAHANASTPLHASIVNGQVAAAVQGRLRRRPRHLPHGRHRTVRQPAHGDVLHRRPGRPGEPRPLSAQPGAHPHPHGGGPGDRGVSRLRPDDAPPPPLPQ
ncbi:DUF1152 domain-containing protein [Luedemannella flava]